MPGIGSRQVSSRESIGHSFAADGFGAKCQLMKLQKLVGWNRAFVGSSQGIAESFVVREEVGFATPDIGGDRSPGRGAEAVEMVAGLRRVRGREVILPSIRAHVVVEVILVDSSMHRVVTAPGDDLRL